MKSGNQLSGISYQVSAIRYQLSGISYQVSAISYQVSAIRYQLSGISDQLKTKDKCGCEAGHTRIEFKQLFRKYWLLAEG